MCLLLSPLAISARISRSRGESWWIGSSALTTGGVGIATLCASESVLAAGCGASTAGSVRSRPTSLPIISGLTTESPSHTLQIESHRSSVWMVLSR